MTGCFRVVASQLPEWTKASVFGKDMLVDVMMCVSCRDALWLKRRVMTAVALQSFKAFDAMVIWSSVRVG